MNRIEQLIEELCPDGVEFKELSMVAEIGTGSSNGNEATDSGKYPLYVRSKIVKRIDTFEFDEEAIIIPGEGGIGEIFHYINGKYALHQRAYRIKVISSEISTKFLCYYMMSNFKEFILQKAVNATVISIRKPMIAKFPIPLPPLPIQQEIVTILDTFTALDASLQAELEARRKQYEHYRNQLLNFEGKEVEWKSLGEVCDIFDGTHQTPKYTNEGVRFVSVENIKALYETKKCISKFDYENLYKIKPQLNDVFMTRIGSIGACAIVDRDEELAFYVTLTLIRPNQNIVKSKFIKFFIESSLGQIELRKRTLVNAVPIKINLGEIGKIKIPLPPLSEQERIVGILDKFDALVSSTGSATGGIPAEIAARRKQYEYYREKLLSFEIKGNK
ncbi:MAG TPA: restriction endonuclease subunit S [Bacteroidales bacterium]|nr:restriction endonuclease subunit S [Bacteroidales bacterium]